MSTEDLEGPERTLTPADVAALFRVDPKTVTRWAQAGKIKPAFLTLGGHRRFREADVLKLLNSDGPTRLQVRYWKDYGGPEKVPAVRGTYTNPQSAQAALAKAVADGYDRPWLARWNPKTSKWERVTHAS